MKIKYKNILLNLEKIQKNNSKNYILFLHGFTGSLKDWIDVTKNIDSRFNIAILDFIGHGESDSPEDENLYSTESIIEQIDLAINNITNEKIILAGYSMGGRAALSYASKSQDKLKAMILESAAPGITSENLRKERITTDEELANFILENPIEKFINYWMNIDLFKSQKSLPKEKLKLIHNNKLKNNKVGLANSLKGFGSGKMPPLFENLKNIKIKTLLISGELDEKFRNINLHMSQLLQSSKFIIVKGAGHNAHLEKEEEYVNEVNNFLNQF
jgi:2-succinyl-6-hydroxy-2,4-cyclohexadiene-1-carboxylate synthase